MKFKFALTPLLGVLALLSFPVLAAAHHGSALYDQAKPVTMKGVVTDWTWANPHCLLDFDVKDDKGNVVQWDAEASNPLDMIARGWSKKMFKVGDEITITVLAAKNGEPVGRILRVTVNGKTYEGLGRPASEGAPKQ